ncbi:MAG: hypothetical protein JSS24_09235 [Proteobacteria bacterium]|nr:hypothetical protein [Pseudomonadota bacterium]
MKQGLLFLALTLFLASGALAGTEPREVFDERTGATFIVVHDPLIFPVGHLGGWRGPMQFVSLTALERDHAGELSQYLVAYAWTELVALDKPLTITLDDRTIQLQPLPAFPPVLPDDQVMLAPGKGRIPRAAYTATRQLFKVIAASKRVSLTVGEEGVGQEAEHYDLVDGQKALGKFIQHVEGAAQ